MNLNRRKSLLACIACLAICFASTSIGAQEVDSKNTQPESKSNYNWKVATLGGTQFWTDVYVVGGWRIQRNSYWGHYRLLDDQNVRHAWGSEKVCRADLQSLIEAKKVIPYAGKTVIVLHGLCRSWKSMSPMANHLETKGYQVVNFHYASTRKEVSDHARQLRSVINGLPKEVTEINFVGHSLGNIVVRHYVADCNKSDTFELDKRINRMVMLGPPNQGSRMARLLKSSVAFKLVAGASGAQLSIGWDKLEKNLATPKFEFGIVAGNYGNDESSWSNILLPGPDDFTVSEKEASLPGAIDFLVKPLLHTTMMHQQDVLEATTRFLKSGHFVSAEKMNPITSESSQEDKE